MRRRDSLSSLSVCVYQSILGRWRCPEPDLGDLSLCAMFKQADLKAGDLRKRGSPQLFYFFFYQILRDEGCQGEEEEKKLSSLSGSVQIV